MSKVIQRFLLSSTIISFILISFSLLSVSDTPATGYELSIYSSTPMIFWIAIIYGLLNGLFLIASDLYGKTKKMWILGLFQILFCNFSVISLYALRGYVLYLGRSDILTYVGLAKDISEFGNFGKNLYPMTSIFISQFSQLTNLPIIFISKYISSLFYILYVLSIYCWSKSLIADRKFILSSLIASMPIFFAWFSTSIYHELLSVFTLPFFFYLLQRNSDYRFKFLSIIFLIIYPFFHPITGIVVILYLSVFFITEKFNLGGKIKNVSTSLLLLSFVSLVAWFIQRYSILRSIKSILFQLIGLLKVTTVSDLSLYYMNKVGITTAIRTLGLMIADEIIFCLLSLFVIYRFILRKDIHVLTKKNNSIIKKFYKNSIYFIIGNFFLLIIFFSTYAQVPTRLMNLNFNLVLTPPFVGYLIYTFLLNNKRAKAALVLSLIFASAVIAIFSLYPSPITMLPNKQVTIMDVKGTSWLITQKNTELKTGDLMTPISRFAQLIHGCKFLWQRPDLIRDWDTPPHFGFTDNKTFPIDEDRYLFITEYDVKPYIMELWKDFDPAFEREDFIKINSCTNVDKIYENGEFRSFFVHSDG